MVRTDLNLLKVILAIYDQGSVTLAAQSLGMSQPAVSSALVRLRADFEDQLFIRFANRMNATPLVESMLPKLRESMEMLENQVLSKPVFLPENATKEWVFCLSEVGEIVFLPDLYKKIKQLTPHAKVRTVSLPPDQLPAALHSGTVDLALGYFPDLNSPDIYQQRLFSHELACLVRADHEACSRPFTLEAFKHYKHLQVSNGSRSQEMYEGYLEQHNIERSIALETSHFLSVPTIISGSDLIAVIPRTVALLHGDNPSVTMLPMPMDIPLYDLKQHWHARHHKDPRNQWLRGLTYGLFAE